MKLSLSALLVGSRQTPRARVLVFRPCVIVHLGTPSRLKTMPSQPSAQVCLYMVAPPAPKMLENPAI
jgi:hypothetical protein